MSSTSAPWRLGLPHPAFARIIEQHCFRMSSSVRPCSHFPHRGSPPFLIFEASLPAMEETAAHQQIVMPYTAPRHREHDPMDDPTQPTPASTSHSDARNLLLLQDYVRNVSQAQLMLEQTSASLQRTEILTGIFSEHDLRTLRTACQRLNSLRIRVEARVNTVERAMIEQQLQFMQSRVQPVSTEDLRTDDTSCPSRTYADHFMSQDHSH